MRAGLSSATVTPGRTARCSSVTMPVMVPVCVCARTRCGAVITSTDMMARVSRGLKRLMRTSIEFLPRLTAALLTCHRSAAFEIAIEEILDAVPRVAEDVGPAEEVNFPGVNAHLEAL